MDPEEDEEPIIDFTSWHDHRIMEYADQQAEGEAPRTENADSPESDPFPDSSITDKLYINPNLERGISCNSLFGYPSADDCRAAYGYLEALLEVDTIPQQTYEFCQLGVPSMFPPDPQVPLPWTKRIGITF